MTPTFFLHFFGDDKISLYADRQFTLTLLHIMFYYTLQVMRDAKDESCCHIYWKVNKPVA